MNAFVDVLKQFYKTCKAKEDTEISNRFGEPMVWIGIYIAIASFFSILAMAADVLHGFQNKKFWFPCRNFSLNAASITVITVTMKLPVDLSSAMPSYMDQATKLGSLGFMCTMMANLMPSLASLDNKTLLANLVGFVMVAYIYTAMTLLLLIIMISSSLTIPTSKEVLDSKYQAINKMSLSDQSQQHIQISKVEELKQHVRRYWVMAETGSPQFVMASNPSSAASGIICVLVLLIIFLIVTEILAQQTWASITYESQYKWSMLVIFITQIIGILVGTIAPVFRCFTMFNFKLVTKWNGNRIMFFKVEWYWTKKLHEWKQSPTQFLSSTRRSRSFMLNLKNIVLSLCIGFQKVIVVSCKVIWLIAIAIPILIISCLNHWKSLKSRWFSPPNSSRTDRIDKGLKNYVLQINNEMELAGKTLKRISNSINSFISKAAKEENNNLIELLKKSTGFKGVEIFDTNHVQPLLPVELVNSWSLLIVTLTCIAVALPNIPKDTVGNLFTSVGEGLSYTHLVEESLSCASEYVNLRMASVSLWHEVENKCKWLDNPLANNVLKGKTATEILKWFSNKAKEIVIEINESTNGELVENTTKTLIAANSMFRITQTILLRFQSNIEPFTTKQLFAHLNGMIADIFSACFTNIPRVIRMRCHECVIEKREASVKIAAKLLGKTTRIIEILETREVPSMDDEKMAYIDEWRLYMKQSIP